LSHDHLLGNQMLLPLLGMGCNSGRDVFISVGGRAATQGPAAAHADGATMMSSAGTSVFTETCGQVSPLKFSSTVCVY
jgi:hypothetical protein